MLFSLINQEGGNAPLQQQSGPGGIFIPKGDVASLLANAAAFASRSARRNNARKRCTTSFSTGVEKACAPLPLGEVKESGLHRFLWIFAPLIFLLGARPDPFLFLKEKGTGFEPSTTS